MNSELQNLFNEAVQAQSQGKEVDALALYKSLKEKGFTSPAVELNEALLLEKQEDYGRALADISVAQRLARRPWLASDIQERVQKKVASNRAYSLGTFGELMEESAKVLHPSESFFLAAIFLGIFLINRALGFKNKLDRGAIAFTVLFLIFGLCASFSDDTAYVVSDAELKTIPIEGSAPKLSLYKGTKVSVLRESKDYAEVERPGDFIGWVKKDALSSL